MILPDTTVLTTVHVLPPRAGTLLSLELAPDSLVGYYGRRSVQQLGYRRGRLRVSVGFSSTSGAGFRQASSRRPQGRAWFVHIIWQDS